MGGVLPDGCFQDASGRRAYSRRTSLKKGTPGDMADPECVAALRSTETTRPGLRRAHAATSLSSEPRCSAIAPVADPRRLFGFDAISNDPICGISMTFVDRFDAIPISQSPGDDYLISPRLRGVLAESIPGSKTDLPVSSPAIGCCRRARTRASRTRSCGRRQCELREMQRSGTTHPARRPEVVRHHSGFLALRLYQASK